VAARLARDIPGAFKPDQYWNAENPRAHERTTGPEIWEQTEGRITHLVASPGTGGTISGATHFLKARKPDLVVVGADPEGSVLSGDEPRPYLTEGVGEDFLPGTFDPTCVDRWVRVSDREAFAAARRLTREEGILAGESSGTVLVGALDETRRLMAEEPEGAPGKVLVVILPDTGRSYLSKLYDDEWMRKNGLLGPATGPLRVADAVVAHAASGTLPAVVLARTGDRVAEAIEVLQRYGISQMPVSEAPPGVDSVAGIVGSISEKGLLDRAYRDPTVVERTVGEIMDRPLPTLDATTSLDDAFELLSSGAPALVATDGDLPLGVVTKLDLLELLARRSDG
jgi:cystathionine beta-synthase